MHKLELTFYYDKILVLDQGKVVAFDSPATLFGRGRGLYHSMVEDAGLISRGQAVFGTAT
ncbi:hypothetical protein Neosp_013008 [[Neocosmospora] mangrovei]